MKRVRVAFANGAIGAYRRVAWWPLCAEIAHIYLNPRGYVGAFS